MIKKYSLIFTFGLLCIITISAYIQFNTDMNLDASNGLHEATLLFSGGKYFHDFYETTPPLFLYLNFPIVEILKHTGSSYFFIVFFCYYLLLSLTSVSLCYLLSKKIFSNTEEIFRISFLLIIAAVFLIQLPCFFGEREHTAIILTLPYFLLLSLRADQKKVSIGLCAIVAVFSGIGFAIKPQFCIPFFLSEIYLLVYLKQFSKFVTTHQIQSKRHEQLPKFIRTENTMIISLFFIYTVSTYLLYPDYFHLIIPQAITFYYQGIPSSPYAFLKLPTFIFSIFIILFFLIEYKNIHLNSLSNTLFIGLVGFILTYFSQQVMWEYHFFPAYSLALILSFVLVCRFLMDTNYSSIKIFFYIIWLFLFYQFYIHHGFTLQNFNYYIEALLILLITALFIRKYFWNKALHIFSGIGILLMILIYPAFTNFIGYQHFKKEKEISQPLVNFIHHYAYHQTAYFLSATLQYEYPAVDYAGGIHVSRFPYLIWMPSYIQQMLTNSNDNNGLKSKALYHYFMLLLAKDIATKKPRFIFVDTSKIKKTISYQVSGVNYLSLFLRTPEFKSVMTHYHYFKTIHNEPNYTFEVYELS